MECITLQYVKQCRIALITFLVVLVIAVTQFSWAATDPLAWSKTAKWRIHSAQFHDGLAAIAFDDPLGRAIGQYPSGDVVRKMLLIGYIDKMGKQVIPPRFFHAGDFSEGLAAVRIDSGRKDKIWWKWGYIDRTGKVIIKPRFDDASDFHEGLALVKMSTIKQPMAPVEVDTKLSYIDRQGRTVIKLPKQINEAYPFMEKRAVVKNNQQKCVFINQQGQLLTPQDRQLSCEQLTYNSDLSYHVNNPSGFRDGLLAVEKNNKYGYVDRQGRLAIALKFDQVTNFSEGLAIVQTTDKTGQTAIGCIDRQGRYTFPPQMAIDNIRDFREGLAAARDARTKRYGFIDRTGKFVIPPKFDQVMYSRVSLNQTITKAGFSEGFAIVTYAGKQAVIDKTGKMIFSEDTYKNPGGTVEFGNFKEGLLRVNIKPKPIDNNPIPDGEYVFLNKSGNIVIRQPK
jgi:WG containing repeat